MIACVLSPKSDCARGLVWFRMTSSSKEVESYLKNTPARNIRMSLAIYLCKMKSGMSNQFLSTLFNISKSSLRRAISSVRKALMNQFVPSNNCFAASSVKIPSCKCCEQHLLPGGSITFCSTKAVVLHNCEITSSFLTN
jgi:hypothetical protein